MNVAPPALVERIERLHRQFQAVADRHPWVCIRTSSPTRIGSRFASVGRLSVAAGRLVAPDVLPPADPMARAVTNHVNTLTFEAALVLGEALPFIAPYPDEDLADYRPRSSEPFGHLIGWVRWLRYTTGMQKTWVAENYPQLAVTALFALIRRCTTAAAPPTQPKPEPAPAEAPAGRPCVNARMLDMLSKDPDRHWWPASKWATALGCGDTSVKESPTWKQIMAYRAIMAAERIASTGQSHGGKRRKKNT